MTSVPKPTRIHDRDHLREVAQRPCCVCVFLGEKQTTRTEAHHTETRGSGGGDDTAAPLCTKHHQQWHLLGRKTFLLRFKIDVLEVARVLWKLRQKFGSIA